MIGFFYKALLVGTAVLLLAACDNLVGGGGGGGGRDDKVTNIEDNFGASIAAAFRADANSEPIDPTRDGIIAVSFTADPIDF